MENNQQQQLFQNMQAEPQRQVDPKQANPEVENLKSLLSGKDNEINNLKSQFEELNKKIAQFEDEKNKQKNAKKAQLAQAGEYEKLLEEHRQELMQAHEQIKQLSGAASGYERYVNDLKHIAKNRLANLDDDAKKSVKEIPGWSDDDPLSQIKALDFYEKNIKKPQPINNFHGGQIGQNKTGGLLQNNSQFNEKQAYKSFAEALIAHTKN